MIQSDYLDLAIGLAVVFFLGGLVVSGLNEGINWITRVRAKFLWAYLYDLFDDRSNRALPRGRLGITKLWQPSNDRRPPAGGGPVVVGERAVPASDWLRRIAHALDPIDAPQLMGRKNKPVLTAIKNVPPASLAQALLEVFADIGRQEVTAAVATITDAQRDQASVDEAAAFLMHRLELAAPLDVGGAAAAFRERLAEITASPGDDEADDRKAAADALTTAITGGAHHPQVTDAWRKIATEWPNVQSATVASVVDATGRAFPTVFARLRIEAAVSKLDPASPLAATLRRLWEAGVGHIDDFRTGLESYFDAEMQRLSGYYRRSIRVVMFSLALVLAVAGGFDAISVTRDLWRNPDDRAALVQRADELVDAAAPSDSASPDTSEPPTTEPAASEPAANPTASALQRIQQECDDAHPVDDATINSPSEAAVAYRKVRTCVTDALDELSGVGVLHQALWVDKTAWADAWSTDPVVHPAGTLLAALALMLGAPFWFDIIKRLTGIRKGSRGET